MTDQLLLYDQAMLTWVETYFPPLLKNRTTDVLASTPRKAYAEVVTRRLDPGGADKRTLPRITIQRLDVVNDPMRYNASQVRRLGWCNPPSQVKRVTSNYPVPVQITYQIDLWARFVKEMNLWERFVMESFAPSYMYLQIRPNDVWGDKMYIVFLEGPIADNSDLEPGEGERQIRKTFTLRCECWMFPDVFVPRYAVKRIEAQFRDSETQDLLDTAYLPPIEVLDQGDGIKTSFGPFTLARAPVLEHTAVVQSLFSGTTKVVNEDGSGNWVGAEAAGGSITYSTGVMTIDFVNPPDLGADVSITYFTDLS